MAFSVITSRVHLSILMSLCFLIASLFVTSIKASSITYSASQEFDRIINLPGQPSSPSLTQFSGYITVNQDHGRALFYWFFEALSEPGTKPLILWLNGGPGCSSIGYGAAVELGPLRVNGDAEGVYYNNYTWITEANLLFLESPVGVGFSYTNTSSDLTILDDTFVAADAYTFLVNWLQKFPQYKTNDFYISGESYGGHYIPQLAEVIYDRNQQDTTKNSAINLKGFIVGNPETDDYYDSKGLLDYAWSHTIISDQEYDEAKRVCDFRNSTWSDECNKIIDLLYDNYKEIDIYNIYVSKCLENTTSSLLANKYDERQITESTRNEQAGKGYKSRRMKIFGGYDPCFSDHTEKYFNRRDVQSSFHVDSRGGNSSWQTCSASILRTYNYTNFSILPIYTKLIKGGLKIWIYSGDTDGRVPVIGSRYCVESLGLPIKAPWRSWYHNHQVGGKIIEYEGLTLVTVRGAGHLVPLNRPSEALALLHSYLTGEDLPKTRFPEL